MDSSGDPQPIGEERIIAALAEARERDVAPPRLHAQIRAMHEQRGKRSRGFRGTGVYAGGFATAVAAVVALVILVAPGGTPGAPTLAQAAALATRPVPANSTPAPIADRVLNATIGGIAFPYWEKVPYGGWRAVGERADTIAGRRALTVYYRSETTGREIAYTIVAATKIPRPNATVVREAPSYIPLRTVVIGGRTVTTWRERGSSCVLSGAGVPSSTLEHLAARS